MTGQLAEQEAVRAAVRDSPYVGLVPYSEEDASFFFGREDDEEIIAANLKTSRLTLLYGASGVGKTSLLLAGVVPLLRELTRERVDGKAAFAATVLRSWRNDPLSSLTEAIRGAVVEATNGDTAELASASASLSDTVHAAVERVRTLLVVLDQFEDYFLYHPDEDGDGTFAVEFPRVLTDAGLRVNFLISIREDAWAKLDRFEGRVPGLFGNYLRVDHLGWDAARRAIERPIEEFNRQLPLGEKPYSIDPELVEVVLNGVKSGRLALAETGPAVEPAAATTEIGGIETPFLQLVMERLWLAAVSSESRELQTETLDRLGGAERIVKTYLGNTMNTLEPAEQEIAAELFRYLVTPSKTKIAHRVADLAYWLGRPEAEIEPVLKKLSERLEVDPESPPDERSRERGARILRPLPPPLGETGATYEIFHDVLAEPILEWRSQQERKREKRALAAQIEAEQAERRKEALNKLTRGAAAVLIVLAAALAAVASWAFHQRSTATREQHAAESGREALQASTLLGTDPLASVRVAQHAAELSETDEAREALRAALAKIHLVLRGHEGAVRAVALSPDGTRLVTASKDRTARVWDTASGHTLAVLRGHTGPLTSASFSPDGATVVTASDDGTARIWETGSGLAITVLRGHAAPVTSASFSPDGARVVTASKDRTARVWDTASGRTLAVLRGHAAPVTSASFSPDGARVVTASDDVTARIWETASGRGITVLRGHDGHVRAAAFSPDGTRIVTASNDRTARIWEAETGRGITVLRGHMGHVRAAAFSPDGTRIVTASDDGTARIWTTSGRAITVLRGHADPVTSAIFTPNGAQVVTASDDKTAWIWETSDDRSLVSRRIGISAATSFADGVARVVVGTPNEAQIKEVGSRRTVAELGPTRGPLQAAALSPDGTRAVTMIGDETPRVWDVTNRSSIELFGHTGPVFAASFSRDGERIATTSLDGTSRVWDASSGRSLQTLGERGSKVVVAALDADGDRAATGSGDGTVRIWDVSSGAIVLEQRPNPNAVSVISFSPDGDLVVAGSIDGTVRVLQVSTGQIIKLPPGKGTVVNMASFNPDGGLVVVGSTNGAVRVLQVSTGQVLKLLRGNSKAVVSMSFTDDGARVVTAGLDGTARIYACELCGSLQVLQALADRLLGSTRDSG